MEEFVPFGSEAYLILLALMLCSRGMDFLSTWVATPNLVLEGNPIVKRMGWKWSIPLNLALCFGFARWSLPAIVLSTTSVLVAAHNFQQAWLMRSLGEERYGAWYYARMQETRISLRLFCLFGQTLPPAGLGGVLFYYGYPVRLLPMAIGLGIITYAVAVVVFTLLSVWRMRRAIG